MAGYDEIARLIEQHQDDSDFEGPMNESDIIYAEDRLCIAFAKSYRLFLLNYGCGDILGQEFYGIIKNDQFYSIPSVIFITEQLRKNGLPKSMYAVYNDGSGRYSVLESTNNDHDESPVYQFVCSSTGNIIVKEATHSSFADLFVESVGDMID